MALEFESVSFVRAKVRIGLDRSLNTQAIGSAAGRGKSFAHVAQASWGKGPGTLLRIMRMTLRHPWQVAITILSTFIAATLQLFIPRLLGHAIDQAQGVVAAGANTGPSRRCGIRR